MLHPILAALQDAAGVMDAASAVEGMARQPEIRGDIQTAAIILAALIEGAALFGLVITLLYRFVG